MKKNKLPRPISILILTLLTAIVWVSLNIYRTITTKPAPSVPQDVSQSLNPILNKDSVGKIESAIFLDDSQIPQIVVNSTSAPVIQKTPTPLETPIATSSANSTETP